jgi:hypothetical protein
VYRHYLLVFNLKGYSIYVVMSLPSGQVSFSGSYSLITDQFLGIFCSDILDRIGLLEDQLFVLAQKLISTEEEVSYW